MKNFFLFLFAFYFFLIPLKQYAYADAVIFSGSDVKALKSNLDLNGGAKVISQSGDPTSGAVSAPKGSILLDTGAANGYIKQDAGSSTNWNRLIFGSSSGIVSLASGGTAKALVASAGSIAYSDSDSLEFTSVGSNGQFLRSAGTGTPIWSSTLVAPTVSGDLTLSAGGIVFPATQVASANANTLDDYEEGTFTATIEGMTSAGVGTYVTQVASYVKIGNTVFFYAYVQISAHTGTGFLAVGALPFTSNAAANNYASVSAGFVSGLTLTASHVPTGGYVGPGVTRVELIQTPVGGGTGVNIGMDTAFTIMISGFYKI